MVNDSKLQLITAFAPYYKNRRVLITGADGFVGSHLAETLLECGANVTLFVRGSSRTGCGMWSFRNIEAEPERFSGIIAGDIASPEASRLICDAIPEIIFHLAAIAYVDYSFTHPLEVFRVNAIGTQNVLEATRTLQNRELVRTVIVSSSEVYGTSMTGPIREDHPLNPTSPYAASKLAADRLAFAYRSTYNLPLAILRPFNSYGPRHIYDVIPKFIRLALTGKPLIVHGDGAQQRDFSFVTDTLQGILLAGSHPQASAGVFNIGSGSAISVSQLAKRIIALSDSSSRILYDGPRKAEVASLLADTTRAATLLGFTASISLEQGLLANINWMRQRIA